MFSTRTSCAVTPKDNMSAELHLLREIYQSSEDAVVVIEKVVDATASKSDWRYISVNDKATTLLGTNVLVGKTIRESFPQADELWYEIFEETINSKKTRRIEKEAKSISLFLEVCITCIKDHNNKPLLMLAMRDITQRRTLATNLKNSQEVRTFLLWLTDDLRDLSQDHEIMAHACESVGLLLGVGRCGFAEVSACGKFLEVKTCWTDGIMANAIGRHRCSDFGEDLISLYRRGYDVIIEDVFKDERTQNSLAAFKSIGGVRACLTAPLSKQGAWVGSFFVQQTTSRSWSEREQVLIREVAARSWDAVERARAEKQLRLANERKDVFLATLAHELRNPLAPISAGLQLLKRGEHTPKQGTVFEMLERQTKHMTRLVDELLDVMRISRGLIVIKPEIVDIKDILQSAFDICRPEIERNSHTLSFRIDDTALPVNADGVRLTQVFSNIINNACKFTPPEGTIAVDVTTNGNDISIQISDTGIGLEEANFDKIFDLFSQVAGPGGSTGGLGIGLNLARRLVEKHNGTISAFSPGLKKGSTFTVTLPIALSKANPSNVIKAMPDDAFNGISILVVDDNQDAAASISMLLRDYGATSQVCYNGPDALEILKNEKFDAVLLDLGMPDMDGYEVAQRIRAIPNNATIQLIALTGWGEKKERDRTKSVGFDGHLTKPADPYSIWQALKISRQPITVPNVNN